MKTINGIRILNTERLTFSYKAFCWGWFICCAEKYEVGYLNHELCHARDFKQGKARYIWKYFTDWRFRAYSEIRAYSYSPITCEKKAHLISTKYWIKANLTAYDVFELEDWASCCDFEHFLPHLNAI